jgi:hypothetical protein
MKLIVLLLLLGAVVSLGFGLSFLSRRHTGSKRTVKALTWRIALSIAAFALLMLAWAAGWIQPHGIAG